MGAWGSAIMSSDLAADMRVDFKDYVADGKTPAEARLLLAAEYQIDLKQPTEDTRDFWLVLSQIEWSLGRLEDVVRNEALQIIESGANITDWQNLGASAADIKKRAAALEKLKDTLLSPQPEPKKLKKRPENNTPYSKDDVFFFQHQNGKYYLFLVYDTYSDKGGTYACVRQLDAVFTDRKSMEKAKLKKLSIRAHIRSMMILKWSGRTYSKLVKNGRTGYVGKGKVKRAYTIRPAHGIACPFFDYFEPGHKFYYNQLFDF